MGRRSGITILHRAADDIGACVSPEFRRFRALDPLHDAGWLFLTSPADDVYLFGPNTIGKSYLGAGRLIMRLSGFVPMKLRERKIRLPLRELPGGRPARAFVLGISREQAEQAAWAALMDLLPPEFIYRQRARLVTLCRFVDVPGESIPKMLREPGATIRQRTVEARRKRGQGGQFDEGWLDEEHETVDVYNEYGVQLGKRAGRLQGTLTALETLKRGGDTWVGREVIGPAEAMRGGTDVRDVWLDEHVHVIFGKKGDQVDAVTGTLMSGADIESRIGRRCSTRSEYLLRVEGKYDILPERPYFAESATEAMSAKLVEAPKARCGLFVERDDRVSFEPSDTGLFRLYYERDPRDCYAIGCDPASGTGPDFLGAVVYARRANAVAGVFQAHIEPAIFKHQYYLMHLYYGSALLAPEAGPFGAEIISYLRERCRGSIFRRPPSADAPETARVPAYGVSVGNERDRDRVIEAVTWALLSGSFRVNDPALADEIRRFGWFSGRPDHPRGGHDDLLFALGYALIAHRLSRLPRLDPSADALPPDAPPSQRFVWGAWEWQKAAFEAAARGEEPPDFDPLGHRARIARLGLS